VENVYIVIQYAFSLGKIEPENAAARDFWLVTFKVRSVCYLGHVMRTANRVQPEVTASGHSSSVT
jgi:hypothetical protein